MERDYTGK